MKRLALTTALAAGAMAIFAATPALAYNQPLNEHESGVAFPVSSCELFMIGGVNGSPISGGFMEAILEYDCSSSADCLDAIGEVILDGADGEIDKLVEGRFCIVSESSSGAQLKFKGSYSIVDGSGAYSGATGVGAVSWTFDCGGGGCEFTGSESSGEETGVIPKTGGQPENVLLCSPTLVKRSDGSLGIAVQVPYADYAAWLADPSSHPEIPAGAVPAKYGQDIGLTCDQLPGYVDTGKFVDAVGAMYGDGTTIVGGNFYPYWVKASS